MIRTAEADFLIAKLEQRDQLSDEEKTLLGRAIVRVRKVGAREDMVREGDRPSESTLLLDGFAARYKVLRDGSRQITAIHIPGDFVDLHSLLLRPMDHAVVALTACKVAAVPHDSLRKITDCHPHLTRLLWLSTLIDGAIHREWLVALGRRPALGSVAHLLCELFLRLQTVGLTEDNSFQFALTQGQLGDALGLSNVHVNRVVQELRKKGTITWHNDRLTINDWKRLAEVAEFDPAYLNLIKEPR